jgi:hypothetical protein
MRKSDRLNIGRLFQRGMNLEGSIPPGGPLHAKAAAADVQ